LQIENKFALAMEGWAMDTFKVQLQKIQQQLNGLSASQKMLTASLVAIMVMTIVWWSHYAGTAEMEPVLDQSLSAQDIGQIKAALDSRGITTKVVGDRVMVPADRKLEAVAMLAYADALPSNSSSAWDEMTKAMSPWDSTSKTESMHNHMREQMISNVITSFFPGVAKANVIINPVRERRIGGSVEPTASVQITTRGNDINTKRLVEACAATVASAIPDLSRSHVSVVIDGVSKKAQDPNDSLGGGDLYDQIAALEKSDCDKITSLLMPGTLCAVTVAVDANSSQETREIYDASKTVSKEKTIETNTEETSTPSSQGSEPGAQPNVGLSIAAATPASNNATSTIEKNHTENAIFPSRSVETINKPAGTPTVVSVAVRVPRSYFVAKYKAANANAKDPDENALQTMVTAELPGLRKDVQNAIGMKSDDAISVDTYFDTGSPLLVAVGTESSTSASISSMVGGHVKEIAVGVLALVSLFMVSTIVKKGSPMPAIPVEIESRETQQLSGEEALAGIVGNGNVMLDGMEMDEDAVHAQQMVEQVSTMVKEDPDAAANLVKRWLNR
jgi:flagellar biosynthesis/type III secretory pathway M-ring protein FliF/YscJ